MSENQFAQMEAELANDPSAHGWEDQCWTLNRVKTVIGRRFHLTYTVQGVRKLLVRNGWSCQVPARRAVERDDEAVAGWVKEVWPRAEGSWRPWSLARLRGRGWILHDAAAGENLVTARPDPGGAGARSFPQTVSIAALNCYKPGQRSLLIYWRAGTTANATDARASPGAATRTC
jgi:hypothetical protein